MPKQTALDKINQMILENREEERRKKEKEERERLERNAASAGEATELVRSLSGGSEAGGPPLPGRRATENAGSGGGNKSGLTLPPLPNNTGNSGRARTTEAVAVPGATGRAGTAPADERRESRGSTPSFVQAYRQMMPRERGSATMNLVKGMEETLQSRKAAEAASAGLTLPRITGDRNGASAGEVMGLVRNMGELAAERRQAEAAPVREEQRENIWQQAISEATPSATEPEVSRQAQRRSYASPTTERTKENRRLYGMDTTLPEGRYSQITIPEATTKNRTLAEIYNDTDTLDRWRELASKDSLTAEEKKEARAARKEIKSALGFSPSDVEGQGWKSSFSTDELPMVNELFGIDTSLNNRTNAGAGIMAGVVRSLGIDWLSDRIFDAAGVRGEDGSASPMKSTTTAIQTAQPGAFTVGNIAGSTAEMLAISGAVGNAVKGVKWFTEAAPWVQRAIRSAITFGASGLQTGITSTQTKEEWDEQERKNAALAAEFGAEYTRREYSVGRQLANVGISTATGALAGAAGGAAETGLSQLGGAVLTKLNLTGNRLARTIAAGISGMGFAAGSTAVRELEKTLEYPEDYKPNAAQIAQDLLVAFAFSSISYLVSAGPGVQQAAGKKYSSEYFDENMTEEEARRVYRELARRYHPDTHPGDAEAAAKMAQINADYEALRGILAMRHVSNAAKAYQKATTSTGAEAATAEATYTAELLYLQSAAEDGIIPPAEASEAMAILTAVKENSAATPVSGNSHGLQISDTPIVIPPTNNLPAWYAAYQNAPRPIDQPLQQRPNIPVPASRPATAPVASPVPQSTQGNAATPPAPPVPQRGAQEAEEVNAAPAAEAPGEGLSLPPLETNNAAPEGTAKAHASEVISTLRSSISTLSNMQSVSTLSGNEFQKSGGKLTEQVGRFFKQLGNTVTRQGFGSVILDPRGVKSDIAHGVGRAKAATFAAVPQVISQGEQIDYQENWKGRGSDSYVFAAPVDLAGKRTYVAAVVMRDQANRFYLHEVLDEDGKLIYKIDAPANIKTGVTVQDGVTGAAGTSDDTVPYLTGGVNGNPSLTGADMAEEQTRNAEEVRGEWLTLPPLRRVNGASAGMAKESQTLGNPGELTLPEIGAAAAQGRAGSLTLPKINQIKEERRDAQGQRTDAAAADGEKSGAAETGNDLADGGRGRLPGQRAGEQNGRLERLEEARRSVGQRDRAIRRRADAKNLRAETVDARDHISEAAEGSTITLVPEEMVQQDRELRSVKKRLEELTGRRVYYTIGGITRADVDGTTGEARGAITARGIYLQCDNNLRTVTQLAAHELYHYYDEQYPGLSARMREKIKETFGEEEFYRVAQVYLQKLGAINGLTDNMDAEASEAALARVEREIFADAFGSINFFSTGVDRFTELVRGEVNRTVGAEAAAAKEQKTGPPETKFSGEEDAWDNVHKLYAGRNMAKDGALYTYDFLANLPPTESVNVPSLKMLFGGKGNFTREQVIEQAKENAVANGEEKDGKVYVQNKYTGRDLRIDTESIRHGLKGDKARLLTNARMSCRIGEIAKNAVPINGLKNETNNPSVEQTYAMVSEASDQEDHEYIVVLTVERQNNAIKDMETLDVIHALNARNRNGSRAGTKPQGVTPPTTTRLSIEELLRIVNSTHQSLLSDDVYKRLNPDKAERQKGYYTDRALFSMSEDEDIPESAAEYSRQRYREENLEPQSATEYARMKERNRAREKELQGLIRKGEATAEQRKEAAELRKQNAPQPTKATKSQASIAKKDLRNAIISAFSIPNGRKAEIGKLIDAYADRLLKDRRLTETDRKELFDRLYSEGVMTAPADDMYQAARELVNGGRVYVPESVKREFGDDWASFRREAFAQGILLTNNSDDRSWDSWNQELSEDFPGLFREDEYDPRTVLEQMVRVAEEGKGEKLSLAEYAARVVGQEYVSEDELLDNMERQLDWALRTFADKAGLETWLRDKTNEKLTRERERFGERLDAVRSQEIARRAREREKRKEAARQQALNRELREMQQRTLKQLQWLSKNRQKFSGDMQGQLNEILSDIDVYAVSAANEAHLDKASNKTWRELADIYEEAKKSDPNFLPSKDLERIVDRLRKRKIGDMDIDAVTDLYKAAAGLRTEFYNRNKVIGSQLHETFQEVYDQAKSEIRGAKGGYQSGAKGTAQKWFSDLQLTPLNLLERMAGWNPDSAWYKMAKQLEQGERAQRRFKTESARMLAPFLEEHKEWIKKADGQGKDAIWYEVEVPELMELGMGDKPIFGNTVKVYMTPAQKVHMYLESQNYDNLRHMTGGRTFADRELYSQGKRAEAFAQGRTICLAPETVKNLVKDLTPEEKALADALRHFYNEFSKKEINRVSNLLLGYDKAMERNYAPIYTNQNYTKSEPGIFDTTAEGVGNLKSRVESANPSLNISALDAFEKSVDRTSRYVGLAIPVRNMNTLMNWREEDNSMADVLTHKWGKWALAYINGGEWEDSKGKKHREVGLLNELQGGRPTTGSSLEALTDAALSKYISAVFGANPSIVLKQFASYPLAGAYMGRENMPKIWQVPRAAKVDTDLVAKYTGELDYRLLGYAMPETATLKDNPGKLREKGPLNFLFGGGAITWMDGFTVRTLWTAAENKVNREQPDLERGTQAQIDAGNSEYYKAVAAEFEEAVSRSQPMYDIMHRANIMRESNPITRAFTLFKTVPLQEYNMLRQTIGEAQHAKEANLDKEIQAAARQKAGRAFAGILIGNLMIGAITMLNSLWKNRGKKYRDEDGNINYGKMAEEFGKQYFKDAAGLTVGGGEAADILSSILFGDKWYGLETPGMEQIGSILEQTVKAGQTMQDLVRDSIEVLSGGGNWAQYMADHSDQYLSAVDSVARTLGTYATGLPIDNVKAYLLGTVQWLSPKVKTAYEDLMDKADRSGLKGLKGASLEIRTKHILQERAGKVEWTTVEALAGLYEAGYRDAIPAAQVTKVTVGGEERKLNLVQQQTYKRTWQSVVRGSLDELVGSEVFRVSDEETQAKMLKKLYDLANGKAAAAVFEDYKAPAIEKADAFTDVGASLADYAAISGSVSGQNRADSYEIITDSGMSDEAKLAAIGNVIGTDLETDEGNPTQWARLNDAVSDGVSVDRAVEMMQDGLLDDYTKWRNGDAKGAGISAEDYLTYRTETGKMSADKDEAGKSISGSKKAKVLDYIDGMKHLTVAQKDVLYYDAGYAESGIEETPWHKGSGGGGSGSGNYAPARMPTLILPDMPQAKRTSGELTLPRIGGGQRQKSGGLTLPRIGEGQGNGSGLTLPPIK